MTDRKQEIEAALERSLRSQVKVPRLPRSFDAAVWSRIDAQSVKAPAPANFWARWQFMLNGIGIGAALVMTLVFGAPMLTGLEANIALPQVTLDAATIQRLVQVSAQWVTGAALAFGVLLTPLGRRIRRELRELL